MSQTYVQTEEVSTYTQNVHIYTDVANTCTNIVVVDLYTKSTNIYRCRKHMYNRGSVDLYTECIHNRDVAYTCTNTGGVDLYTECIHNRAIAYT